ncbi:MAG: hypothetical protein AABY22_12790, partial [Nanoarchaeota archaeon]
MIPNCAIHNKPMRSGHYGFYCPTPMGTNPNTGKTIFCNYKPEEEESPMNIPPQQSVPPQKQPVTREPIEQPDWEKIAEGKVRS